MITKMVPIEMLIIHIERFENKNQFNNEGILRFIEYKTGFFSRFLFLK